MQLTQTREYLLEALQAVLGAIEKRHTAPILENVLLRLDGTQAHWRGTDLEVEIALATPVMDGTNGATTLPARKLADICKALPADSIVTLKVGEDKRAHITAGRSRFELATLPPEEFPELADLGEVQTFSVPERELKCLLNGVAFAMANQDVRYYLNGLLLETTVEGLRSVATDGHRLALVEYTAATPWADGARQLIVPRKGALELARLLRSDSQVEVQVQASQNHLRVQWDNLRFTTKLIDGRYPDYRAAVPNGGQIQVEVDRKSLRATLARVAVLASEKFRGVRLNLGDNLLQVQAHNPEQETAADELDVAYQGKPFQIGFNVSYLLDALDHMGGDSVQLHCNAPETSMLLTDPSDASVRNVIMPIRL